MIGHQREVLAQLGIDVWIPREVVCQETDRTLLWRDQAVSEIITQIPVVQTSVTAKTVDTLQKPIINKPEIEQPVVEVRSVVEEIVEERPRLEIEPFSLQALVLSHLVIIIDSTEVNAEQQQLWGNIQRAIHSEFYELNWPFALENMNDGHGVENYIQGFIDSIAVDKKVIVLGKLPHSFNSDVMCLATLADMLKEPLLKRRLWNFIQNKQGSE